MHKSVTTALIALLLIASPLMMFGTSDSNIFSKAMAIEEDKSETDIKSFIKSNDESEEKDDSSDEEKDDSSDEEKDDSSNAIQQNQNNDEPKPVVDTSQPTQQIQNNEPQQQQQTTKQSQQGNKGLSIISQEEMQQQQYENFKKLYESVKQQHKEIEILK